MADAITQTVFFGSLIGGLAWWIWDILRQSSVSGVINLDNGRAYAYEIGNRLASGHAGTFKGARVALPKHVPNIYVDGTTGDKGRGSRYFFDRSQLLQLEGDFNKYFMTYAPKGQEVVALSWLTPDVMQTLKHVTKFFDVELLGRELVVYSHKRPYHKPRLEQELLAVLTVLVTEIDHKLRSWTPADEIQLSGVVLKSESIPTVKVGGATLRLSAVLLGTIYALCGICAWLVVFSLLHDNQPDSMANIVVMCGLAFLYFPFLFVLGVFGLQRGWLNGLGKFIDWYTRH